MTDQAKPLLSFLYMPVGYKSVVFVSIIGAACIFFVFYRQGAPAREFQEKFKAPVIAVEVDGKTIPLKPYVMTERAEFGMGMRDKLEWPILLETSVVFILQNGTRINCLYMRKGDEIRIAEPPKRTFFAVGVGKDLWPIESEPSNDELSRK